MKILLLLTLSLVTTVVNCTPITNAPNCLYTNSKSIFVMSARDEINKKCDVSKAVRENCATKKDLTFCKAKIICQSDFRMSDGTLLEKGIYEMTCLATSNGSCPEDPITCASDKTIF